MPMGKEYHKGQELTMSQLGLSLGELLGLRWCDVDLELAYLISAFTTSGILMPP